MDTVYTANEVLTSEKAALIEQLQASEQSKTASANQIMNLNLDLQLAKKEKESIIIKYKEAEDKIQKIQE